MSEKSAMSDSAASHKRHQDYSYRLPTPPRILVPPPSLTADNLELNIGKGTFSPDHEVDTSFLKDLDLANIVQNNTLLEWAYERRRQAQMILPWLYLGPLTAAKDKEFLVREGITMVLAIRAQQNMNGALNIAKEVCYEVATVESTTYYALVGQFSRTTKMINQHIAKVRHTTAAAGEMRMGKVLVFCESGNERSAAVVAAYLMEMLEDFDYVKAMQVCQAQRFCVNFEDSIKNILKAQWDILLAQRSVATSRSDSIHSISFSYGGKPKRTIEDTRDDEDMEMSDDVDPTDELRFSGRANTPFRDQ
ncbi:hypothetical protein B0J11DRAFT_459295 [Dendryphion nanum]|uniref:Tyrosine specific protein phosphatases domain-containing protein n=1 Tax=Dendryphion nanum TaxID=256645 RepID=A0A9P9IPU1_9PLEO|nr:hypothetical protein B0J11DRAFT_459295 [Dendryphion nanum]